MCTILFLSTTSFSYIPIILQFFIIGAIISSLVIGTHLLGPKVTQVNKLSSFECGIEQQGNARNPLAIKYFLVAILFVLFDVEVIFFYPYALNLKSLGWQGFIAILTFVSLFLVGFIYIVKKGVLDWED